MTRCAVFQPLPEDRWYERDVIANWVSTACTEPGIMRALTCRCGGMVDAADSKSAGSDVV